LRRGTDSTSGGGWLLSPQNRAAETLALVTARVFLVVWDMTSIT
jgi:hypothetical protein